MLLVLGLVNDRALRGQNIHPHLERFAEARATKTQEVAAASRATNEVINIQSSDEADEIRR